MLRQQLAAKMLRHERWDARSCFLHRSLESRMKYVSDIRAKQFRELSQYEFFKSCVRRFCARSGWHWSWPPARCVLKLLSHVPLKFTASLKKQWTRNPVFFFFTPIWEINIWQWRNRWTFIEYAHDKMDTTVIPVCSLMAVTHLSSYQGCYQDSTSSY